MDSSFTAENNAQTRFRKAARIALFVAITGFIMQVAIKAVMAALDSDDFPETLAIKVELLPVIFPLHMVTGGLALLVLPLTYTLRHRRMWHRWSGRVSAGIVLISGLTAFPVAWVVPVTSVSAAGFSAQATLWLILLARGITHIRQRRVAAHRACMLMMMATTSGAVVFRILLALWAKYGTHKGFETFYALDAWIAWLIPFGLCAVMLWRQRVAPRKRQ